MKRFLITIIFLSITTSCFSQKLDSYKYVVIPYEFSFLKKHDKYRINSLVRFLFKKEGFQVLYNSETFPQDLADNRCLALYVDIDDDSGIFITKTKLILKDCSNQTILESIEGQSRTKACEKAYNETIREEFTSIKAQNYSYKPAATEKTMKPVVAETVTKEVVPVKDIKTTDTTSVQQVKSSMLYAQPLENGFQLVDNTPKVMMILLKTGISDVYLVKGKDAIVYKENGKWMLSNVTTTGNKVSTLNVKF